jgi:hypothetical protein
MSNTLHYILILDKSGSMAQLKQEVILSFNEQIDMILKLARNEPNSLIKLTVCFFNDTIEFKFIAKSIDQIKRLTLENYQPDSFTALYDAIGVSFVKISELVEPGDQVFFAIFTDGLENASKFYSAEDIKYKINNAEKSGWEIKFFCRYEDRQFYKSRLKIDDEAMFSVSLDQEGFKVMEDQVRFKLSDMINKQKNQKS